MQHHLQTMLQDVLAAHRGAMDTSHHGVPQIVTMVPSGGRGRPKIHIDRDWLAWAIQHRTTSGIATFLGVSRTVVRNALLEYHLADAGPTPFPEDSADIGDAPGELGGQEDDLLDQGHGDYLLDPVAIPTIASGLLDDLFPSGTAGGAGAAPQPNASAPGPANGDPSGGAHGGVHEAEGFRPIAFTGPLSTFSDHDLDNTILRLKTHYRRAGITILDGMLRRLGLPVGRERIRQSLLRIDPVQRVFDRIRIRRRKYQVAGPNALWHHDGQHGLCIL